MTRIILFSALFVLLAGCSMAGPGIAQVGSAPTAGNVEQTTYNSQWVNQEDSAIHDLENTQHMSVDISNHKLGIRNRADRTDGEGEITRGYVPAWKKRQNARKAARKAERKSKGGITTMPEEQKQREPNE
ncbi:MAG: hypothetical protein V3V10_06415 [Planctomycetota bacterium]